MKWMCQECKTITYDTHKTPASGTQQSRLLTHVFTILTPRLASFLKFLGNHLHKYSKVLDPTQLGAIETVPLPDCPTQAWSKPEPLNITAPENLHKQRWLLSVNLDQVGLLSLVKSSL